MFNFLKMIREGTLLQGTQFRKDKNTNWTNIDQNFRQVGESFDSLSNRINNLITGVEQPSEIADGRGDFAVLNDRFENEEEKRKYQFYNYLNYQTVIFKTIARPVGKLWPQGFSINQDADEIYIARQENSGTVVTITRYKLSTGDEIDNKSYTVTAGSYAEGIPYFYNSNQELCFIVRTEYQGKCAIFNYSTGVLGTPFDVLGSYKIGCDNTKTYFISGNNDNDSIDSIYVYDFQSVCNGQPELLFTIDVDVDEIMFNKVQAMTMVNDRLVFGQGETYPSISSAEMNGNLKTSFTFSIHNFAAFIQNYDNSFDISNVHYENEGITHYRFEGYDGVALLHVLVDNNTGREMIYITVAGDQRGTRINVQPEKRPNFITAASQKGFVLSAKQQPNDNLLNNGHFEIWQRGTSFSNVNVAFTADQWMINSVNSNNAPYKVSRIKKPADYNELFSNRYGLRVELLSGTQTTTHAAIVQAVENLNRFKAGSTYTVGFWARTNKTSHRIRLQIQAVSDDKNIFIGSRYATLTPDVAFFTFTFTMIDLSTLKLDTELTGLKVQFDFDSHDNEGKADPLINVGDYVELYLVKLEKGDYGTPYVAKSYGDELLACQRYFQIRSKGDINPLDLSPSMFTTPTITQVGNAYQYDADLYQIAAKDV